LREEKIRNERLEGQMVIVMGVALGIDNAYCFGFAEVIKGGFPVSSIGGCGGYFLEEVRDV